MLRCLVPPDHPLRPEPDGEQAAWWLDQLEPWGEHSTLVNSLVPATLPAVWSGRVVRQLDPAEAREPVHGIRPETFPRKRAEASEPAGPARP